MLKFSRWFNDCSIILRFTSIPSIGCQNEITVICRNEHFEDEQRQARINYEGVHLVK